MNAKGIITGVVTALAVGLPVFAYGSVLNSGPYKTLGSLLTVLLSGFIALVSLLSGSNQGDKSAQQDMEWLKKHPDMLFPDKSNKAAQWFHIVQHRGQARYYFHQ